MTAFRTRYRRQRRLARDSGLLDTADVSRAIREQFWCWMHDADPRDAILQHYGFVLLPNGSHRLDEPLRITLTASSILVERTVGRLVVPRQVYEPVLIASPSADAIPLAGLTGVAALSAFALLRDLFAWIGSYERWVTDAFGGQHRARILAVDAAAVIRRPQLWWSHALRISASLRTIGKASPLVSLNPQGRAGGPSCHKFEQLVVSQRIQNIPCSPRGEDAETGDGENNDDGGSVERGLVDIGRNGASDASARRKSFASISGSADGI